jgi:hypothetical protein
MPDWDTLLARYEAARAEIAQAWQAVVAMAGGADPAGEGASTP